MEKTSNKIRFAYALPAFALAIIGIPVYVYIPKFYTDVVGIDIAVTGILLAAYTISAIGSNLPATLTLYYVQYVLDSSQADLFLLLYFTTGVLLLPVWVRLAHRFIKKETWVASIAVNTSAFLGVFFLGPGGTAIYR